MFGFKISKNKIAIDLCNLEATFNCSMRKGPSYIARLITAIIQYSTASCIRFKVKFYTKRLCRPTWSICVSKLRTEYKSAFTTHLECHSPLPKSCIPSAGALFYVCGQDHDVTEKRLLLASFWSENDLGIRSVSRGLFNHRFPVATTFSRCNVSRHRNMILD